MKDQNETFVSELLGAAVAILGTTPPPALRSDKTAFSVHPKKVKLVGVIITFIEENSKILQNKFQKKDCRKYQRKRLI